MTFTSKKEADAFDKMLDIADNLTPFLLESDLNLDEATCEKLSFYMAQNKESLGLLLKGMAPQEVVPSKKVGKKTEVKKSDATKSD